MTTTAEVDRSSCRARLHGTASAYKRHDCRCDDTMATMRVKWRDDERRRQIEGRTSRNMRTVRLPARAAAKKATKVERVPPIGGVSPMARDRRAKCRAQDPDLFYPDTYSPRKTRQARQVCFGCPLRQVCLWYALEHREPYGVWGGFTPSERARLARAVEAPSGVAV